MHVPNVVKPWHIYVEILKNTFVWSFLLQCSCTEARTQNIYSRMGKFGCMNHSGDTPDSLKQVREVTAPCTGKFLATDVHTNVMGRF